jgi:hypothetical protein
MKITRTPIDINALSYSREWNVDRSTGVHLMSIVEYIAKVGGIEKAYDNSVVNLDNFAVAGYLWEHVMSREEQLDHAMSLEALRMHMTQRKELLFPGEMFWCADCDRVMTGGRHGQEHARKKGHRGIYSTPDAYDYVDSAYVEWKFTWKSSKRSAPDVLHSSAGVWRWPVQCMWNCMTLGCTTAKLVVLHCNGDYSKGLNEPEPYEIRLEFSDREILRNKRMIVSNARDMKWI